MITAEQFILAMLASLFCGGGVVTIIIKYILPSKEERTNDWNSITKTWKEFGDEGWKRLGEVEKEAKDLLEKISILKQDMHVTNFKYKISINFNKDLLKRLRAFVSEEDMPYLPSEIEKDILNGDKDGNE